MSTMFIAVQCYQCSTMQVKQQKKSSNKWICVICNEKQSVRKVFARGFQAKDVRQFVQGFNTARQFAEQTLVSSPEEEEKAIFDHPQINNSVCQGKRRTDWSQYLDPEEEHHAEFEEDEKGEDYEPEIVTEFSKEMFKKPKLKNYSNTPNKSEGKKLYSPTFAKRKPNNNKPSNSQVKNYSAGLNNSDGKKLYSPTFTKKKTDIATSKPQEYKGAGSSHATLRQGVSKWNDYLAEDEDYLAFGTAGDLIDAQVPWNNEAPKASFTDQRVEEEVHPDFH